VGQSPCLCQENSGPKIALLDSHLYRKPSLLMTIADSRKSQRQIRNAIAAEAIVVGAAACLFGGRAPNKCSWHLATVQAYAARRSNSTISSSRSNGLGLARTKRWLIAILLINANLSSPTPTSMSLCGKPSFCTN
jgi:hypothetical protein